MYEFEKVEDAEVIKGLEKHLANLLLIYGIKDKDAIRNSALAIYKETVKPAIKEEWERAVQLFYPVNQDII